MGGEPSVNHDMHGTNGCILSRQGIIDAVKNGEIKIKYYCVPSDKGTVRNDKSLYVREPDDNSNEFENVIWNHFLSCVEEDSLRLSVGPYALVEGRGLLTVVLDRVFRKGFFRQQGQNIFNIFKDKDQALRIYPKENCVIGTNEVISVSPKIGGSLYAAVRNTDVGLPHISTTIDPCWSGKLQIGIVNPTNSAKELHINESICKVRFHRFSVDGDCGSVNKKPHANDWWELEKDKTSSYFPRRKEVLTNREIIRTGVTNFSVGASVVAVAIGAVVKIGFPLYDQIQEVEKNADKMEKYGEKLHELEWKTKDYEDAANQNALLRHDVYELTMVREREQFSVALPEHLSRKPYVFVNLESVNAAEIKYTITYPSKGKEGSRYYDSIIVNLFIPNPSQYKDKQLTVHTVILADQRDRIQEAAKTK